MGQIEAVQSSAPTNRQANEIEISGLVSAFFHMVEDVKAREEHLQRQMQELRIEIDQVKKIKQVSEITETEYFKQLQTEAQRLRERARKARKDVDSL